MSDRALQMITTSPPSKTDKFKMTERPCRRPNRARIESTVLFQIDRKGNLKRAHVYRSSGLPLYDQEALRVVQDSAPFAVPPSELQKMDGNDDGVLDVLFTFTVYQS